MYRDSRAGVCGGARLSPRCALRPPCTVPSAGCAGRVATRARPRPALPPSTVDCDHRPLTHISRIASLSLSCASRNRAARPNAVSVTVDRRLLHPRTASAPSVQIYPHYLTSASARTRSSARARPACVGAHAAHRLDTVARAVAASSGLLEVPLRRLHQGCSRSVGDARVGDGWAGDVSDRVTTVAGDAIRSSPPSLLPRPPSTRCLSAG